MSSPRPITLLATYGRIANHTSMESRTYHGWGQLNDLMPSRTRSPAVVTPPLGEIANRQLVKVDMTFGDVPIGIVEENGATTFLKALVVLDEARKAGKIDYISLRPSRGFPSLFVESMRVFPVNSEDTLNEPGRLPLLRVP